MTAITSRAQVKLIWPCIIGFLMGTIMTYIWFEVPMTEMINSQIMATNFNNSNNFIQKKFFPWSYGGKLQLLKSCQQTRTITPIAKKGNLNPSIDKCKKLEIPTPALIMPAIDRYINNITFHCKNMVKVGSGVFKQKKKKMLQPSKKYIDGLKYMCMDDTIDITPENCLSYSFGIANFWKFEDDIVRYGCEVFAFDPTMGKNDFDRSEKIHFYNLGISNFDGFIDLSSGKKPKSKVATLQSILKKLCHEDRKIDYFKIDIEGSEIPAFDDIFKTIPEYLSKKVAQIGMEVHFIPMGQRVSVNKIPYEYWKLFQRLKCYGFELAFNDPNVGGRKINFITKKATCCYELLWVNVNLLKKK